MSTVGCHCVDMDAVDECLSLSVDTVDTYSWAGPGGSGGGKPPPPPPLICITDYPLPPYIHLPKFVFGLQYLYFHHGLRHERCPPPPGGETVIS